MNIEPASIPFTEGLHRLSQSCYAWLQPPGGFCLSNAGVVVSDEQALVVDTCIDRNRTQTMLDTMRREISGLTGFTHLVNTHGDVDHTGGNCLLPHAHSIMARGAAQHYANVEAMVAGMYEAEGPGKRMLEELGLGKLFDPRDVTHRAPDELFDKRKDVQIGDCSVHFHEFGPAHNKSDTVVHVHDEGVAYAGDLMFCNCHPVLGYWPIQNWVDICDTLLRWGAHIYVPGHGPVAGPQEVQRHRDYVLMLHEQAKIRFNKGMSVEDAAYDMFVAIPEFQRLFRADILRKNVNVAYHEFMGKPVTENFMTHSAKRWQFRERIRGVARGIHVNHVPDSN